MTILEDIFNSEVGQSHYYGHEYDRSPIDFWKKDVWVNDEKKDEYEVKAIQHPFVMAEGEVTIGIDKDGVISYKTNFGEDDPGGFTSLIEITHKESGVSKKFLYSYQYSSWGETLTGSTTITRLGESTFVECVAEVRYWKEVPVQQHK